jgi:hypothetical protein
LAPWALSRASAEVVLSEVRWQVQPAKGQSDKQAQDVTRLVRTPDSRTGQTLGAVAVLRNEGNKPAVGVLIRYCVEAKVAPVTKETAHIGTWTVPFWWEQAHIPQIAAGQEKKFSIHDLNLDAYLRRLSSEGFWPTALRIRVMAEPRRGDDLSRVIAEAELPIEWSGEAK